MSKGYFLIWRSIQDNPLWKEKPFSRGQAWVDLIMMAQHSDGDIHLFKKGFIIEAKRGDVLYGLDFLMKRWGWGKGRVIRFKDYLIHEGMASDVSGKRAIKQACAIREREAVPKADPKPYPKFNILSIENYNNYQDAAKKNRTPKRTHERTDDGRTADPPNKCIKNEESMSAKKKADPDVKTFILEWIEIWSQKFGKPYTPNWGKDGKLVKEMLKIHSLPELRELRDDFFRANDPFIAQSGYSIGFFKTMLNKLIASRKLDPVEQARQEMRNREQQEDPKGEGDYRGERIKDTE